MSELWDKEEIDYLIKADGIIRESNCQVIPPRIVDITRIFQEKYPKRSSRAISSKLNRLGITQKGLKRASIHLVSPPFLCESPMSLIDNGFIEAFGLAFDEAWGATETQFYSTTRGSNSSAPVPDAKNTAFESSLDNETNAKQGIAISKAYDSIVAQEKGRTIPLLSNVMSYDRKISQLSLLATPRKELRLGFTFTKFQMWIDLWRYDLDLYLLVESGEL